MLIGRTGLNGWARTLSERTGSEYVVGAPQPPSSAMQGECLPSVTPTLGPSYTSNPTFSPLRSPTVRI
ncbi:hypothetical protein L210DRAFT_3571985, partial [Boletus edulis BED1]